MSKKINEYEKALIDIDASSRNSETSTSINFGTWVGIGACKDIVNNLHKYYQNQIAIILDMATNGKITEPETNINIIKQKIIEKDNELIELTKKYIKSLKDELNVSM